VTIQIEQKAARCRRCGKLLHPRAERIEAVARDGARVLLCSARCRDEYARLGGLAERSR
jgi:NMD protein affecting ribosome stability and mRNA decay